MKRMLINATQQEELRVALVDGQKLYDLDIETTGREQKKANIYKGKITRIEPSLEAAFVDYGAERHGFLPLKEIAREYFKDPSQRGRLNIKDAVQEGQELIVQIDKEERGQKGAALTTFISLAGCYVVLMPNNPRAGGISRRIEGEEREELRDALRSMTVPQGMGCIVRTAGVGRSAEELQWDLGNLLSLWKDICDKAEDPAPFLIHQESHVLNRAVRDYLRPDIGELIVDKQEAYEKLKYTIERIRPDFVNRIKLYTDREIPLFNRYQIESQIESAFQREVQLPSGGSIVIDPTEAMISIDINSARATKGSDIEETALNTNIEAAQEIARQLRLRDIGGLIVIDFIDMTPVKHQREVESVLKEALKQDRARVQIGRISRFGLLEMSRQRLRPSLGESSQHTCPRCNGVGRIRGIESLSLSIFRLVEEEAIKESTSQVQAFVPVEVATFLLNEKRKIIAAIEKRRKVKVVLIPHTDFETPHFEILRLKEDDVTEHRSFELKLDKEEGEGDKPKLYVAPAARQASEEPAVQNMTVPIAPPPAPAPRQKKKEKETKEPSKPGLIKRILNFFFGESEEEKKSKKQQERKGQNRKRQRNQNQRKRRGPGSRPNNKGRNERSGEQNERHDKGGDQQREERKGRNRNNRKRNQSRDNAESAGENRQQDNRNRRNQQQPKEQAPRGERQSRKERSEEQSKARSKNRKLAERERQQEKNQKAQSHEAAVFEAKDVKQESPQANKAPQAEKKPKQQKESVVPTQETVVTPQESVAVIPEAQKAQKDKPMAPAPAPAQPEAKEQPQAQPAEASAPARVEAEHKPKAEVVEKVEAKPPVAKAPEAAKAEKPQPQSKPEPAAAPSTQPEPAKNIVGHSTSPMAKPEAVGELVSSDFSAFIKSDLGNGPFTSEAADSATTSSFSPMSKPAPAPVATTQAPEPKVAAQPTSEVPQAAPAEPVSNEPAALATEAVTASTAETSEAVTADRSEEPSLTTDAVKEDDKS
ncbi:ribonuclease E [Pleionea sp. CnH1-48]|uniref:ribonuclease E n=1 Tax=Pleionea sp. CnH1-48 TaxID=2954494 RepID=UPI002097DFF2|nr:ribonuclease E [Pleionea sp. CnH1-48]MCO7225858.1 ribonuclease E [Pleionea sp. CnH1-48]